MAEQQRQRLVTFLAAEVLERLDRLAEATGETRSGLARRLLLEAIAARTPKAPAATG